MADVEVTPNASAAEQSAPITVTGEVAYSGTDAPVQPPVSLQQLLQAVQQLADRVADHEQRLAALE